MRTQKSLCQFTTLQSSKAPPISIESIQTESNTDMHEVESSIQTNLHYHSLCNARTHTPYTGTGQLTD